MMVDVVHSALRIVAVFLKQMGGLSLLNGPLEMAGRSDHLVKHAVLVPVRAGPRRGR